MLRKFLVTGLLLAGSFATAQAAQGNIPFSATIGGTCVISVLSSGTLTIDGTLQNLNSLGNPALASVYTTSTGFNFSMDTPSLIRPPTDTSPLSSIGGAIHITGATTANRFDTDAPEPLNKGTHSVNVFMFSSKAGPNIFTAGTYSGNTLLRCE